MPLADLIDQTAQLDRASLAFAAEIAFAGPGPERQLSMDRARHEQPGQFGQLRAAVDARLEQLRAPEEHRGLFWLAADMALTADLATDASSSDRSHLRALWGRLISASQY